MKPSADGAGFGWIEIAGRRYRHDVVITLDGTVRKRHKKLSKQLYGTSHRISEAEAEDVYEPGMAYLLIGSGHFGRVQLSEEARAFFDARGVNVEILPTPEASRRWNALEAQGAVALFHVTC